MARAHFDIRSVGLANGDRRAAGAAGELDHDIVRGNHGGIVRKGDSRIVEHARDQREQRFVEQLVAARAQLQHVGEVVGFVGRRRQGGGLECCGVGTEHGNEGPEVQHLAAADREWDDVGADAEWVVAENALLAVALLALLPHSLAARGSGRLLGALRCLDAFR